MNKDVTLINQLRKHQVLVSNLQKAIYKAKLLSIENPEKMITVSHAKYLKCFGFADIAQLGIEPTQKNKEIQYVYFEVINLLNALTKYIKWLKRMIAQSKNDNKNLEFHMISDFDSEIKSQFYPCQKLLTNLFILTNTDQKPCIKLMSDSDNKSIISKWDKYISLITRK